MAYAVLRLLPTGLPPPARGTPTSGEVWFDGQPIHSMSDEELAQFRRKRLGFVFQSFQLFDTFTALENVSFPLEMLGLPQPEEMTGKSLLGG